MWSSDQIAVEIVDADHPVVEVLVATPIGALTLVASASIVDRVLYLERAHVGGLAPGSLGRAGLNAIGRKLLEVADVDEIIIQGSARTTGTHKGQVPSSIRFPRFARSGA
jgi:hypothetical protein